MLLLYITAKDNDRSLSVSSFSLLFKRCSAPFFTKLFLYLPLF
jgi:hypothetical protein